MQIIEIKKHITNGNKIGYIMLDDINDRDEIEGNVEDWCLGEPSGHSNGWRSEWKEITDMEHRSKIIHGEVLKMNRHMLALMKKRDILLGEVTISFVQLKSEK